MYMIKSESPDVIVYDGGNLYQFKDGVFETEDAKTASRLKSLGYELGTSEEIDYYQMTEQEVAELAQINGIDIEGKTKRQVINALKKQEETGYDD